MSNNVTAPEHPLAAHQFEKIIGGRVCLLPYEECHVPQYHQWLQDPHIQEMTATEPMDLQTELDYQRELSHSTTKFTKIIEEREGGKLVGDINVFFQPDEDSAELNIMIADLDARKKGLASDALVLTMIYAVQKYNVCHFFVKILAKNEPARRFFAKHGFLQEGAEDVFGEVKMKKSADSLPRTDLTILLMGKSPHGQGQVTEMEGAEQAVGICEFANPSIVRFKGEVKKRYSDFIVDEMDLSGKVAKLTDVLWEDDVKPKDRNVVAEESKDEAEVDLKQRLLEELPELVNEAEAAAIVALFEETLEESEPQVTSRPIAEKADRTKFHAAIRTIFGGKLVTDTVNGDCVRIVPKNTSESDQKKARLDKRNFQDPNREPCLRFVLQKEFMETLEATQLIAKRLCISPKDINTAGTKDKRGITTQYVTIRHLNPAKMAGVNRMASGKIRVSNIERFPEPLRMGELSGNRFTLIIRQVEGEDGDINSAVESLAKNGFINYYGLQRFGTMSVKSHDIGIKLLQGRWQEAVDMILGVRADETDGLAKEARRTWAQTKDAQSAHALFPLRYNAERQILWHFFKQGNQTDLVGAIMSINRDLRLMYVHSVQSMIWNKLVSERIKRFGREAVVGDLVMGKNCPPTILTEATVSKYSIYDVCMPMPGYAVKSPGGPIGELYKEILETEFSLMGDECCFQPKTKGLWDLPGAYRHMLISPKDVAHHIGHYDEAELTIASPDNLKTEGQFKAAIISFGLPPSSYATMALREIMQQHAFLK